MTTRRITFALDRDLIGKLKLAAFASDQTMTAYVSGLLARELGTPKEPRQRREAQTNVVAPTVAADEPTEEIPPAPPPAPARTPRPSPSSPPREDPGISDYVRRSVR
jgi:hypothetical protein